MHVQALMNTTMYFNSHRQIKKTLSLIVKFHYVYVRTYTRRELIYVGNNWKQIDWTHSITYKNTNLL